MFKPTISIIIITRNEERFLPRLLRSIRSQGEGLSSNVELILSDAGSTDSTRQIFKEFCIYYKYSYQIVRGGLPGIGRNNGAMVAHADYLLFLDADAQLSPNLIQSFRMEQARNHKSIYSPLTKDELSNWPYQIMWKMFNLGLTTGVIGNFAGGFCIFVEREGFERVGGFSHDPGVLSEDVELARAFHRKDFGVIPDYILVSHRRFAQIGFFKTFGFYIINFFQTLFSHNYHNDRTNEYFGVQYK